MLEIKDLAFGGSGLDRAAHLRGDSAKMAAKLAEGNVVYVPFWRGRPLFSDDSLKSLLRLNPDHPALADKSRLQIFIGCEEDGPLVFAQDICDWSEDLAEAAKKSGNFGADAYTHPKMPDGAVFAELRAAMAALSPRDAEIAATARGLFSWHENHGYCANCGAKSVVAMSGWQQDCPTCERAHFPRTDPVVIMLITNSNSVLMGRSPGWPEGMYSLLAGFIEPGETIEAAVRREVMEEAGIVVGDVGYLVSQPWPFPSSLMLGCWGEALSKDITIDPHEIEDAIWISREDMMQAFAGDHAFLKPARKGSVAHFILKGWVSGNM